MGTIQDRVDSVIEGFDEVRKHQKPTNGECAAIFAVLLADILHEAGEVADDLARPIKSVLNTRGQDPTALRVLFEVCRIPAPKRKRA